jgi:hypothetical protein
VQALARGEYDQRAELACQARQRDAAPPRSPARQARGEGLSDVVDEAPVIGGQQETGEADEQAADTWQRSRAP